MACLRYFVGIVIASCLLAPAPAARADWVSTPQKIGAYASWVYLPLATRANGKRGLMVVLHGCGQSSTQLKDFGNLGPAAEAAGLVLVVPQAIVDDDAASGCWDDSRAADLIALTQRMIERTSLRIDRDQVYVVGLSSGAAMSLVLGCSAPDLYAGVGAVAGLSMDGATGLADSGEVQEAVERCRSLAGAKGAAFRTQVANIAYGRIDDDKAAARSGSCPLCFLRKKPTREYRFVSIAWSERSITVLRQLYDDGDLGNAVPVQDGKGEERAATADGKVQLGLLAIADVGHAWPAGTGRANGPGGDWIAQSGLNYPQYITEWLVRNNRRAVP